jgi:hypothetical protein
MAKSKKEEVGHDLKKAVERIGHEIKENTELAEHETGINDMKNSVKSLFDKTKKAL